MGQRKYDSTLTLASGVSGAQEYIVPMADSLGFSLQVEFDAGSSGDLSLESSETGNIYIQRTDSILTIQPTDTAKAWGDSEWESNWLKIVLPAGIVNATVVLNKLRIKDQE